MEAKVVKFLLIAVLAVTLFLPACATRRGYQGATAGALVGGAAGALISPRDPWRGAVIGGALGAAFGGAMGDISAPRRGGRYHRDYYRGY